MNWVRRAAVAAGILLLLAALADIGLNLWIRHRLPQLINQENDSRYHISYDDVTISLWNRSFSAKNVVVVPKSSIDNPNSKAGIYAKIEHIEVTGVRIWELAFGRRIIASDLIVKTPQITMLKGNEKALAKAGNVGSQIVQPFNKIIIVDNVILSRGWLRIDAIKGNLRLMEIRNLDVKLHGIVIDDNTLKEKMPFRYRTYAIDGDSIFYRSSAIYHMSARKVATTEKGLKVFDFTMRPNLNRVAVRASLKKEQDIYSMRVDSISVDILKWGFKNDIFFFGAQKIAIDGADADVYRSKVPPDDPEIRKMYSEMLRKMHFPMKVDTLLMRRSKIVYEEELDYEKGPGALTFSHFDMRVTGLRSGFRQTKLPDVKIKIKCNFMESSRLDVDWTFNTMDTRERFNIRGRFFDFPAKKLDPFVRPYLNASINGDLDEVYFNFDGDDEGARGKFAINYDDLKVKIFRKNQPKKKNGLISAIVNLFVKHDSKDKVNSADVDVHRSKTRSFFNLLWKCLEEGLKKILL
jgi:hypothetical protein